MLLSYFYLAYALVNIIRNRDKIEVHDYIFLLAFIIPPVLGGILQSIFYGVKLTWISLTLSILMIFINIQNKQIYIDSLTGLYNKRKLNLYLEDTIEYGKNEIVGGIMIDIDDFKDINDSFGHREGDRALVYLANILKENFRREDFIARYAGDEFLIILKVIELEDIKVIVERLKENIDRFNKENITPYKISISLGYDIFYTDKFITSECFVNRIDKLMYDQKNQKKLTFTTQ